MAGRPGGPARHRRVSDRHRPHGAHHAGHHRGHLRRRRRHPGPATGAVHAGSRVPRRVRRRQQPRRPPRAGPDGRRRRRVRRPRAGDGLPAAAGMADAPVPHRVRRIHRRQFRFPAVAAHPPAGPADRDRRFPQLGPHGQALSQRSAAAAHLHLSIAVCRRGPARRPGGVRGDRLHGHGLGRGVSARRRAGAARRAGRRRLRRWGSVPLWHNGYRARRRPVGGSAPYSPNRPDASPATRWC